MTATLLSRRTGRACCALFALLCLVMTALFAVVDASASNGGTLAYGSSPKQTAALSAPDKEAPPVFADRNIADADNPFEHGRLPLALAGVTAPHPVSTKPSVCDDAGCLSAEPSLPERPPRA